jgi:hypothetical protein
MKDKFYQFIPLFANEFHNLANCALKIPKPTHLYLLKTTLAPLSKSVRTACAILNKIARHPFGHFYETNKGNGYDQNGCGEDAACGHLIWRTRLVFGSRTSFSGIVCVYAMPLARSPARPLSLIVVVKGGSPSHSVATLQL